MIKTEAGEKMKKENPNKDLPEKADINNDGEFQEWEKARHEAIEAARAGDTPEMAMGGLMQEGMGVIIGIEAESGNEIPAGSMPEEVADDIPAMLSEGEYVVPADVVRWHGVKTFEELRCEAKMGMGLMAHDGRIAEVDDETKKPVDYDIEEKDKSKVQKAKVEVVEAADGVTTATTSELPTTASSFYSYKWGLDPETNRYRMIPVDPETGAEVTQDAFDPARSTRYAPQDVIAREVYGRDLTEEEKDQCPEGFYFDEEAGVCMPEEEPSAVTPTTGLGGDGGDGPSTTPTRVDYASQPLTKFAELMGPLSAEDLADYEGETLADKAVSRMTTPADPVQFSLNPFALAASVVGNVSDNIGARRAAETRAAEFTKDPTAYGAYNFNFNPDTGSFVQANPSTRATEVQGGVITDYNNIGKTGTEYTRDQLFNSDINDPKSAISDVLDKIDEDLGQITAVTGGGSRNMYGSDEGPSTSPTSSGGSRTTDAADVDTGRGGRGPAGPGEPGGGSDDNNNDSSNDSGPSDSFGGGRDSDGWGE